MAVSLELHNTGDPGASAEIRALVEHALSDRPGEWRVSIVGSRENDSWEMRILGPNGFERSYTLVGSAGEHQPLVIASVLQRLLPARVARG
jgi:hypothetical protein